MERQESRKKGIRFDQLLIVDLWIMVNCLSNFKMTRGLDYHKGFAQKQGWQVNLTPYLFVFPQGKRQSANLENILAFNPCNKMLEQQNISQPCDLLQASSLYIIDGFAQESFSFLSFGESASFPEEFALLPPESMHSNFFKLGLDSKAAEPTHSRIFGEEECAEIKRTDNTIFKTSLSEYRKSIIDESKEDPRLNWIRDQIKLIYKAKNMSVFPKLIVLARQLNISARISARWEKRSENLLKKKRSLMERGKYCRRRYEELQRSVQGMNATMSESLVEDMIQCYWGRYKQASRFGKSKEEVITYRNDLRNLLRQKASHGVQGEQ